MHKTNIVRNIKSSLATRENLKKCSAIFIQTRNHSLGKQDLSIYLQLYLPYHICIAMRCVSCWQCPIMATFELLVEKSGICTTYFKAEMGHFKIF